MKKEIYFLSLILIAFSSGCSFVNNADKFIQGGSKEVKVYFTKSKGPDEIIFVSANRKVSNEDSIAGATVRELFLGPTKAEELKGLMTEIPQGTRLINVEESEDDILLDVSTQFVTGGGSATMQLRYLQIYKTLNRIAPFKDIYLLLDGKVLKTIGGEGLEVTQPLTKINDYTKKYEKAGEVQP